MRQQEDFRTPEGAQDGAAAPLFDERSALKAAPVVPLARVARRNRFAGWAAGGWRETVNSPQFRRSWPLALLLLATLAAAVAAANFYGHDDAAQPAAPAVAGTAADTAATADAGQTTPNEIDNPREARDTRRESKDAAVPDEKSVVNPEAFTASALGSVLGGAGDAGVEQQDAAASGRDERDGRRDGGKRRKDSKRRQGQRRGGAVLFDVIR